MEARTGSSTPENPRLTGRKTNFLYTRFSPVNRLYEQFKPACPVCGAVAVLMGPSMSCAGGWVNEPVQFSQLLSLLIIMGIYVQSHLNTSITYEIISRKCSRS